MRKPIPIIAKKMAKVKKGQRIRLSDKTYTLRIQKKPHIEVFGTDYGAPMRNRTSISGFGGLRHIHWTMGAYRIKSAILQDYPSIASKNHYMICQSEKQVTI